MKKYVYSEYVIKSMLEHIENALNESETQNDPYYKIGYLRGALKSIKMDISSHEENIGTTVVTCYKQDVIDRFSEMFSREPSEDELQNILAVIGDRFEDYHEDEMKEIVLEKIDDILSDYDFEEMRDAV